MMMRPTKPKQKGVVILLVRSLIVRRVVEVERAADDAWRGGLNNGAACLSGAARCHAPPDRPEST